MVNFMVLSGQDHVDGLEELDEPRQSEISMRPFVNLKSVGVFIVALKL